MDKADLFFLLPIVAGTIIFITIIIIIAVRMQSKNKETLKDVAEDLGAELDGGKFSGTFQGREYNCDYFSGSKNNASHFKMILKSDFPEKIVVRKESGGDRFSKKIGLSVEVQAGDTEFDAKYYISCANAEFARTVMMSSENRRAIDEIFSSAERLQSVTLENGALEAMVTPCALDPEVVNKSFVDSTLERLNVLAENAPAVPASYGPRRKDNLTAISVALFTITGVSLIAGIIFLVLAHVQYPPLSNTGLYFKPLQYSLPALAVFLFVSFKLVRGRSSSGTIFLVLFILCIPTFVVAGMGAYIYTNGYLDKGRSTTRAVPISDKYFTKNDDSTSYYIVVRSWREKGTSEKIEIESSMYDKVRHGMLVKLVTKPGHWGYEWLASYEMLPKNKQPRRIMKK